MNTRVLPSYFIAVRGRGLIIPNAAKNVAADSVYLVITSPGSNGDRYLKKPVGANDDTIFISSRELVTSSSWLQVAFHTRNYYYQVLNNKTYLFELGVVNQRGVWLKY
jgi:hypothetical protein